MFPFSDRCQIAYLFFSAPLGTLSYNTQVNGGSPTMFNDVAHALLAFDAVNKQLYVYTESDGIRSYYLDGSQSSISISIDNVEVFTVDGRSNVIYYSHKLQDRIRTYNITSGEDLPVNDLSSVRSVKDLDMDLTNG